MFLAAHNHHGVGQTIVNWIPKISCFIGAVSTYDASPEHYLVPNVRVSILPWSSTRGIMHACKNTQGFKRINI